MLFKLSLSNIRKSLRDYAIYFFTLIIGVSVFYVFNAIGGQAAMMEVSKNRGDIIELLTSLLSGVSVFVAGVLGLLIIYASRFLMKRRNKEFALYMMLGMGKGKISAILLMETIIIGIGSLGVGLIVGIGLSQLMSALVANLFEADMTAYKFSVSGEAIVKTILYFAVMYLVVMIFNSAVITKMKLIDLIQSGKRSEHIKLKNPWLCVLIFFIAAVALGYAYYQVGWNYSQLSGKKMTCYVPYLLVCIRNAPAYRHEHEKCLFQKSKRIHVPSDQQQGGDNGVFHDGDLSYALCDDLYSRRIVLCPQFNECKFAGALPCGF